ncbi:4'-phosphopantetheinyl transferase family protein [Enterococcus sp. LJL99]
MLFTTIVNIREIIQLEKWNSLLECVDKDRRDRINNLYFPMDKKRSLIGGLLIRAMLLEYFSIEESQLSFNKNFYGKPYLNGYSDIYYNLSHAGDYVCCSVSDTEVGIDVERIDPSMNLADFETFFSQEEWKQVQDKQQDGHEIFFSLWTLKESYVKKIGVGLSKDFTSFSISLKEQIKLVDQELDSSEEKFTLRTIDQNYKLAICSEQCQKNRQKEITVSELLATG